MMRPRVPLGADLSRLLAFLQLRLLTTANPGRRVACGERFEGRLFNNIQNFLLRRRLARIQRRRRRLLGILLHNNPDSTLSPRFPQLIRMLIYNILDNDITTCAIIIFDS